MKSKVSCTFSCLLPSPAEPSTNFNNSQLTHFLSFVCVFESKVSRHALLEATKKKKKKMKFCSCRRAVTESYNRDRGKQNGAIVTIFSLITIILVYRSRKDVLNLLFSRGCFQRVLSSSRWRCRMKMHLKGKLGDTRNPFVVVFGFVLKPVKFLSDDARV